MKKTPSSRPVQRNREKSVHTAGVCGIASGVVRVEEEAALERAENLMNAVCLGTYSAWVCIRGPSLCHCD